MAFSVVMPALEMAQETGKLLAWRKKEGERVAKGEPLLEIETDKAVLEVEAPADGILAGISASEGTDVAVGRTIAWIVAPGEKPPADAKSAPPTARSKTEPAKAAAPATSSSTSRRVQEAKISPKARRLAKDMGVDIATVKGSGSGGEILASDVQASAASSSTAQERKADRIEVPSSIGRLMAERMVQSWTTVPHFFVSRDVDASALNAQRERLLPEIERTDAVRLTHTDLLVALVARVLRKHPRLNASWSEAGIRLHAHVNIAVAIAVSDAVVAAVIPNAHAASLGEIAKHRHEISERARTGKLRPSDITDATFTLSNLGMYGVDAFSAIITPPQAAILAVGAIADRVVAIETRPVVRPMMTMTLSSDHRVVDGARAALFLQDLAEAIGKPEALIPKNELRADV
jgi:pyruvate dehydrogenase E2 component (dihydrolipoamide acetyltransferase)